MKNAAFGSLTSTLTSKTQKTSKTHLRWLQICLTGAVVTVQLHRLREGNGPEMRACGINYGRAMSFIWSILSRTMTQQSQKEKKRGSSFLAWVWKSVLCKANLMKRSLLYIKGTYPWASHRFGLADRIQASWFRSPQPGKLRLRGDCSSNEGWLTAMTQNSIYPKSQRANYANANRMVTGKRQE